MVGDRELIARVIAGDAAAQDLFVDRFSRFIYAILVRHLRLRGDTPDEIFQAVFVHLWEDGFRRLRLWRGDGDFVSYLAPIVRHLALRRVPEPTIPAETAGEPIAADPRPDEIVIAAEQRAALARAVEELSPRDAELYDRRIVRRQSYREIAAAMEITVNNVGVSLARLQERLGQLIAERDAGAAPVPRPGENAVRFSEPEPPERRG